MNRFVIISLCLFLTNTLFAQEKADSLMLKSLSFLEKELHLNFEIENQYILVLHNSDYYIVDKYIKEKKKIIKEDIIYDLKKQAENKYSFTLKIISVYRGTFEVIEENGNYLFKNLSCVEQSPPLISVPHR